jgi:hypothetical protein
LIWIASEDGVKNTVQKILKRDRLRVIAAGTKIKGANAGKAIDRRTGESGWMADKEILVLSRRAKLIPVARNYGDSALN